MNESERSEPGTNEPGTNEPTPSGTGSSATGPGETDHELWEARFISLLVKRGVDRPAAEESAREALAHCAEARETPEQAFGDLEAYADRTATARIPVSRRKRTGHFADYSVEEFWHDALEFPGNYLAFAGIVLWVREGLWTDLTVAGTAGGSLLGVALGLGAGAQTLWATAGRPRSAAAVLAAALGSGALVPLTYQNLSHEALARIPSGALIPVGMGLVWLAGRVRRRAARGFMDSAGTLPDTVGDERQGRAGREDAAAEARRWLRRLDAVLRTRHLVSRRERRRLVEETGAHLTETGRRPDEEFGDAERYALTLVEDGAARRPTRKAVRWMRVAAYFGVCGVLALETDWEDPALYQYMNLAVMAGAGYFLVKNYRDKSPADEARSGTGA